MSKTTILYPGSLLALTFRDTFFDTLPWSGYSGTLENKCLHRANIHART
jgi:hypothetical protein